MSLDGIVEAKNDALAEAAKPALGQYALWFTVGIAIVATASGLIASAFAVSRMLAMLTEMGLVPHRHFGMPGNVQTHMLVRALFCASWHVHFHSIHAGHGENEASVRLATDGR